MQHQFVKAVVLLAAKGESAVILFDKLDGLAHFIFRKAGFEVGEVKFAHKSPRHGITMQYRTVFGQGKTLESMSYGVSQIERLAYAVLFGVLFYNIFLYLYRAPCVCRALWGLVLQYLPLPVQSALPLS